MDDPLTEIPAETVLTPPIESFIPVDVVIERLDEKYVLRFVTPFKVYAAHVGKEDGHSMSRILSPLYVAPTDEVPGPA